MIALSVDPGLTGAMAFVRHDPLQIVELYDMPVTMLKVSNAWRPTVDWYMVAQRIREMSPGFAVIEQQMPRKGQGISSTGKIMFQYGGFVACVAALGLPYETVHPASWKRFVGLIGADKAKSRSMAMKHFPDAAARFAQGKDHNRAEAALIGWWKFAHDRTSSPAQTSRALDRRGASFPGDET